MCVCMWIILENDAANHRRLWPKRWCKEDSKATIEPVFLSQFNWTVAKTHVSSTQKLPFKDLAFCPVLTSEYTLLTLQNIKVYLLCFKKKIHRHNKINRLGTITPKNLQYAQ